MELLTYCFIPNAIDANEMRAEIEISIFNIELRVSGIGCDVDGANDHFATVFTYE